MHVAVLHIKKEQRKVSQARKRGVKEKSEKIQGLQQLRGERSNYSSAAEDTAVCPFLLHLPGQWPRPAISHGQPPNTCCGGTDRATPVEDCAP